MVFEMNDVVKLVVDIPEEGLDAGAIGVVVAVFSDPHEAYEIEFCDDGGDTIVQLALLPEKISRID